MAQISCPACSARIPSKDVDLASKLAKCVCGEVFDFTSQAGSETGAVGVDRRRDLAPPAGLTVEVAGAKVTSSEGYRVADVPPGGRRVLTRRWFEPPALFLLFFCIAWDSFLVFWYASAFGSVATGDGLPAGSGLLMSVFPIAHLAVGVGLTYCTAALFLNRTTIELDGRTARVRHGPLFWRGAGDHPLDRLRGVYVKQDENVHRNRPALWSVFLDAEHHAAVLLVARLGSERQARCIAAHVAEHAGVGGP
jgi:hypothetical protein